MMKILSNLLIYVSLIFVAIYLWDEGIYTWPNITDITVFLLSLCFLFLGHLLYVYMWSLILQEKYNFDTRIIFESESITIFNKYIPGKIWVVLGPVSYLKKYYEVSTKTIMHFSFYLQVIVIWSGLLMGLFFFHLLNLKLQLLYEGLFLMLTLLIYTNWLHLLVQKILFVLFKKSIILPTIYFIKNLKPIIIAILMWLSWSLAFYLMILSTTVSIDIPLSAAYIFPIASVIGIVTLFSPGGLGVREGVMVFLLLRIGLPSEISTQISIDSRLWFLLFEMIIFSVSLLSIKIKNLL